MIRPMERRATSGSLAFRASTIAQPAPINEPQSVPIRIRNEIEPSEAGAIPWSAESEDESSADELEEDSDYDVFADLLVDDSAIKKDSVEESENEDESDQQSSDTIRPTPEKDVFNVVSSTYKDDNALRTEMVWTNTEERCGVELACYPPLTGEAAMTEPWFQWIHFHGESTSFEEFSSNVRGLPRLTEADEMEVRWMIERTKKSVNSVTNHPGTRIQYLEPVVTAKSITKPTGNDEIYMFFSIPYFTLARHEEQQTSQGNHFVHTRPLIQSRHPSIPRRRELQQAVCQLPGASPDLCFHVSDLWCLVIRDKYLITYARQLTVKDLCRDTIMLRSHLPKMPATTDRTVLKLIIYNHSYAIPLEMCDTWFKLTALFRPLSYSLDNDSHLFWKGHKIGSTQWPVVVKHAKKRTQCVILKWRKRSVAHVLKPYIALDDDSVASEKNVFGPEPPSTIPDAKGDSTGRDRPQLYPATSSKYSVDAIPKRESSSTRISVEDYLNDFHVIQWLAVQKGVLSDKKKTDEETGGSPHDSSWDAQPRRYFDEKVTSFLNNMNTALVGQIDQEKRTLYQKCPSRTYKEAEKALAGMIKAKLDRPKVIEIKKELFFAAQSLFQAFLPLNQHQVICLKLWGCLHLSITGSVNFMSRKAERTTKLLVDTAKKASATQHQLSRGRGPNPRETLLASHFVTAWFHLLSCLLNMTWSKDTMLRAHKHALQCEAALMKGYDGVFGETTFASLWRIRSPCPAEITAFLAHEVVENGVNEQRSAEQTAWEYFRQLELQLHENPLDRLHQTRMSFLLDEIKVIEHHVDKQQKVLSHLSETSVFSPSGHDFYDRFQVRTLIQLTNSVEAQLQSLHELRDMIKGLLDVSNEHIETNKDRQEGAIYVFTIVTIIFLPISTVSGIMGMNTSDVRDMEQGQWLFWAVAIPVTAVTVFLSLVGAGVVSFRSHNFVPRLASPPSQHGIKPQSRRARRRTRSRELPLESP